MGVPKINIEIVELIGLPAVAEAFVCYDLFEGIGSFSTNIVRGNNPRFDYSRAHVLPDSLDLQRHLDYLYVDFVVFDDFVAFSQAAPPDEDNGSLLKSQVVENTGMDDVLGTQKLLLAPLKTRRVVE